MAKVAASIQCQSLTRLLVLLGFSVFAHAAEGIKHDMTQVTCTRYEQESEDFLHLSLRTMLL